MQPEDIMKVAIAQAHESQTPFGAVIVKDGEIVAVAGNTVEPDNDPTAHAEINAIRKLTQQLGQSSLPEGHVLYSTCEPCPMCAATCVWAGISEIVYGVGGDDFEDDNPNLINLQCQELLAKAPNSLMVRCGVLKDQCKQLHAQYPLD